jgi:hypothetical protein
MQQNAIKRKERREGREGRKEKRKFFSLYFNTKHQSKEFLQTLTTTKHRK